MTAACARTPQVRDEIVAQVASVTHCNDVTEAHLGAIEELWNVRPSSLKAGYFDGLSNLIELGVRSSQLSSVPEGLFDNLTNMTTLSLGLGAPSSSVPEGLFDNLTNLDNA